MSPAPRRERFRPQYHFSMRKGWINDPNGLVYHNGTYHLFCQHNPDDVKWGPMHWSHATSPDLVRWREQEIALYPDSLGTVFSGSAVLDRRNTSGLGDRGNAPLLAFYTAAGGQVTPRRPFTQCLAFSTDGGRSWRKYDDNPVLQHVADSNRDPKVFWHGPTGKWVMVLYLTGGTFGLFGSPDARNWEELSRFDVPGNCECPDLFEIPVAGDGTRRKWIFVSGAGRWVEGDCARYVIGSFDGVAFKAESDPVPVERGGWNYSTQTYDNAPGGRRIFVAWFSTPFGGDAGFPGNPFNGQYRIPWELSLVETASGLRLAGVPVEEVKTLRDAPRQRAAGDCAAGRHALAGPGCRSVDIECVIEPGKAASVGFLFEGVEGLRYDVPSRTMKVLDRQHPWPLEPDGTLALRVLFDVNCLEVFNPDGLKVMSGIYPREALEKIDETRPSVALAVSGGPARVARMDVYPMRSIWEEG
jgi:sucrose-6-phosphate hydrolase SacC (GH32 family)